MRGAAGGAADSNRQGVQAQRVHNQTGTVPAATYHHRAEDHRQKLKPNLQKDQTRGNLHSKEGRTLGSNQCSHPLEEDGSRKHVNKYSSNPRQQVDRDPDLKRRQKQGLPQEIIQKSKEIRGRPQIILKRTGEAQPLTRELQEQDEAMQ